MCKCRRSHTTLCCSTHSCSPGIQPTSGLQQDTTYRRGCSSCLGSGNFRALLPHSSSILRRPRIGLCRKCLGRAGNHRDQYDQCALLRPGMAGTSGHDYGGDLTFRCRSCTGWHPQQSPAGSAPRTCHRGVADSHFCTAHTLEGMSMSGNAIHIQPLPAAPSMKLYTFRWLLWFL